ncbi:hypothetical protein [Variovorax sp. YR752]|uniref:hypothetical protein n=1 Tax=Variovorax sp. YR752 TaxID=1884383 RepID=UPI003137B0BC
MHHRAWMVWLAAALPLAGVAADEALLKAALIVRTFDHYAATCQQRGGFKAADATAVKAWEREHGVAQIRARIPALERDAAQKQQLDRGVDTIVRQIDAKDIDACTAAVTASRTRDAQFATVAPHLLSAPASVDTTPATARTPPAPRPPAALPSAAPVRPDAALLAQIDSFGFDSRPTMGIGGFITTEIYPVVLFRDGRLLTDAEGLMFAGGPAAHQAAHPKDWTRWRRQGGELQIAGEKGWEKLPFQSTFRQLPAGMRLDGLYRRLGGTGNIAVGGTATVAAWNEYRFTPDGRVTRGGGAGARTEAGGGSVVTRSQAAGQQGSYRIEGVMLTIRYDDGSEEVRLIVTHPKDPRGAIWLDGQGYAQRRR